MPLNTFNTSNYNTQNPAQSNFGNIFPSFEDFFGAGQAFGNPNSLTPGSKEYGVAQNAFRAQQTNAFQTRLNNGFKLADSAFNFYNNFQNIQLGKAQSKLRRESFQYYKSFNNSQYADSKQRYNDEATKRNAEIAGSGSAFYNGGKKSFKTAGQGADYKSPTKGNSTYNNAFRYKSL